MLGRWFLLGSLLLSAVERVSAQTPTDADRAQAREIYRRAVAFDSSVEGGETPRFAEYLAGLFRDGGFAPEDIQIMPLERTAALVVRWQGDGSGGRPILLLAHMDVVPAHRADWERDPFTLVEENGYFFGRGANDNKAGLVAITATVMQMRAQGFRPTRDLVIVFTGDEETTGSTAQALLREHRDWLRDAEYALNSDAGGGVLSETTGEPQLYAMLTAEKTYASFTLTARNPGGHSSLPRTDNAIFDLMDAIARVRAYQFPVMWNETTIESFRAAGAENEGPRGAAMRRFAEKPGEPEAAATLSADPSYVGQVRTTCIPTLLQAGHADNALPQSAVATINCRIFPGVTVESVREQLQQLAGAGIAVAVLGSPTASDASPLRDDVVAAATAAAQSIHPGVRLTPAMAAGATDGVFFRAAGIPTYGVGGIFMKESDEFSHGLNERVPVASFYESLAHWRVMIAKLAGPR